MNDLALSEILQAFKPSLGYLTEHLLARSTVSLANHLVDAVQATRFAVLHANDDARVLVGQKGAVVAHNVVAVTRAIEGQLAQNLTMNCWIG